MTMVAPSLRLWVQRLSDIIRSREFEVGCNEPRGSLGESHGGNGAVQPPEDYLTTRCDMEERMNSWIKTLERPDYELGLGESRQSGLLPNEEARLSEKAASSVE